MTSSSAAAAAGKAGLLVSLRLAGKHVLVIGGNSEAASRVSHGLDALATVSLLCPANLITSARLHAFLENDNIAHIDASFVGKESLRRPDNEGNFDVVLGCLETNDVMSRVIAESARDLRIPVNCADVPDLCDFYFVAVVKRGLVQVGVSTNGGGPRLAARLRTLIANALPPRVEASVANMVALRYRIRELPADTTVKARMSWVSKLCDAWSWDDLADMDENDVERLLQAFERAENVPQPKNAPIILLDSSFVVGPVSVPTLNQIRRTPLVKSILLLIDAILSLWIYVITYPVRVVRVVLKNALDAFETEDKVIEFYPSKAMFSVESSAKSPTSTKTAVFSPTPSSPKNNYYKKSATTIATKIQIPALPPTSLNPDTPPKITLLGVGPGNPGLLTIQALQHLHAADVAVVDNLVSPEILALIPSHVRILHVPLKEKGMSDVAQDIANHMCIDAIRSDDGARRVVRVKGGDPFVFGRGGEEVLYFRERGVYDVEVCVGVSSINGVLGSALIPATFKGVSESLLVLTARGESGAWPDVPEYIGGVSKAEGGDADSSDSNGSGNNKKRKVGRTTVIFMPVARMKGLAELMIKKGYPRDLAAAVIEKGTCPGERVVRGTLSTIAEKVLAEKVGSPALLVVGEPMKKDAWLIVAKKRQAKHGHNVQRDQQRHGVGANCVGVGEHGAAGGVDSAVPGRRGGQLDVSRRGGAGPAARLGPGKRPPARGPRAAAGRTNRRQRRAHTDIGVWACVSCFLNLAAAARLLAAARCTALRLLLRRDGRQFAPCRRSKMFFDLNLNGQQLNTTTELETTVETLQKSTVGFKVAAVNTTVSGKNALTQLSEKRIPNKLSAEVSQSEQQPNSFRLLKRLTLILDDSNLSIKMDASNQKLAAFDLLAVTPTTEKAFQHAAQNFDVDIIALDLATKLPFYIKKTTVNAATQRGIYFELNYSQCIRDQTARKNIISNLQQFIRVTNGKNLIISSDAWKALDIRSPHDVINLAQVFGVPDRYARESVSTACHSVLYHAATRRDTMKGIVSVESVDALGEGARWKLGEAPTAEELNADFMAFGDMDEDE
ncbi:hypothetical protein HK100_011774 [Physocladia obscura]|uniref:precorrin-2 dehydrogenase n=1 Tax=Physocladia obscura TaxID=109957 RepID=A0AAD5T8G1_9FUNG|nr:hypothetical protein HK100_011774 [Physocladia obscura]